jgi:hypothetical protein
MLTSWAIIATIERSDGTHDILDQSTIKHEIKLDKDDYSFF